MWYLILVVLFLLILRFVERKTFRWETVIKYLWKQIYAEAYLMADHIKTFPDFDDLSLEGFKSQIELRGNLINSILGYINLLRTDRDENPEEETFGYGTYSFETILMVAKTNPDSFEKLMR